MKSLRHLYKIGNGPSSSHTMGPEYASHYFLGVAPDADSYKVILYGSLALTGKGHLTDVSVKDVFGERNVEIVFNTEEKDLPHENTMDFIAYKNGEIVDYVDTPLQKDIRALNLPKSIPRHVSRKLKTIVLREIFVFVITFTSVRMRISSLTSLKSGRL